MTNSLKHKNNNNNNIIIIDKIININIPFRTETEKWEMRNEKMLIEKESKWIRMLHDLLTSIMIMNYDDLDNDIDEY